MNYNTLLIDGPYLAHRSYLVPFNLSTKSGTDSKVIPTFLRSLLTCYNQFKPNETIIAWESHGTPSWRRAQNPNYKPKKHPDYNFISQVKDLQELLFLLNIPQYYSPTNEADDVIATLCKPGTLIYSIDKDLMQLIDTDIHQWTGKDFFDSSKVEQKFDVPPKLIPDLLAIAGDDADNITGIEKIGYKKASKLLIEYGCLENIPKEKLSNGNYCLAVKNKVLTTLNRKCKLEELTFKTNNTIESILNKYELKRLKESIDDYKIFKKENINEYF